VVSIIFFKKTEFIHSHIHVLGKTTLLLHLIKNRKRWINGTIKKVIFVYNSLQPDLLELKRQDKEVYLTDSIDEAKDIGIEDCLLCIDDRMLDMKKVNFQMR